MFLGAHKLTDSKKQHLLHHWLLENEDKIRICLVEQTVGGDITVQ